jgi:hypothetical protein
MPNKKKSGLPARTQPEDVPADGVLLDELLAHLDTLAVLLDMTQEAMSDGADVVKLSPRSKGTPVAVAVDRVALDLVETMLQVRAQRAIRDGKEVELMNSIFGELDS